MSKQSMIVEKVQERVGSEYEVTINQTKKNNGVEKMAVTIRKVEENIAPNIYIDEFMETESVESIAEYVVSCFQNNTEQPQVNVRDIASREYILKNVVYKAVNAERNSELLESIPHKMIADIAIIYTVIIQEQRPGIASYTLKNEIAERAGVTEEDLDRAAAKNTFRNAKVFNMEKMMLNLAGLADEPNGNVEEFEFDGDLPMAVLTNEERINGAAMIANNEILEAIAKKADGDLLIIPSSIHELIIMTASKMNATEANQIIRQVNTEEVSAEEYLSDNAYLYSMKNKTVAIA